MYTCFARPLRSFLLLLLTTIAFAATAAGQCNTLWLPGPPVAGTNLNVGAMVEWDPDGSGPRTPVVVLGGDFAVAGNIVARCVAAFDPASGTWSSMGGSMDYVSALTVLANGDLVAASYYSAYYLAGTAGRVERWNGTAWVLLGSGFNGMVDALAVLPNGDLIAGGTFTQTGATAASCIARWDGVSWSPLGAGVSSGVSALAAHPNGDLMVGGRFSQAGGMLVNQVARWNAGGWSSLGAGTNGAFVHGLALTPNGDLIVTGSFSSAGGVPAANIARWNGTAWSTLGAGLSFAGVLVTLANGDVVVSSSSGVQRWNGTAWSQVGIPTGSIDSMLRLGNGSVVVGGRFESVSGTVASHVAVWNGSTWSQFGPPSVLTRLPSVTVAPNGDPIIAAGSNATGYRVSRWTGSSWSPLGPEFSGGGLNVLLTTANGDVVAGGSPSAVGGLPVNRIARWNGSSWQPMGSGVSGGSLEVHALVELPGGDIVAGGSFLTAGGVPAPHVARWNGSTWSPLGTGLGATVSALAIAANGDLVAGGATSLLGNSRVARWNGTTWVGLGSMNGNAYALAVLPNGDIVAGGSFSLADGAPAGRVARWNGTGWTSLGVGMTRISNSPHVTGLAVLPDGDVAAGGQFDAADGVSAAGLARWNGVAWSPLATSATGIVVELVAAPDGSILVAGASQLDGVVSAGFARLWTTCPAAAVSSGPGCTGSGGPNVLAATSLPWTGSTYRGIVTGLPANGIAADVYGLSTLAVPLPLIVPQGVAGCTLLSAPDFVVTLFPTGGAAAVQLVLPNTAAFAGMTVYEQVLALDFVGPAFVALTGTNRLTLTIGTF